MPEPLEAAGDVSLLLVNPLRESGETSVRVTAEEVSEADENVEWLEEECERPSASSEPDPGPEQSHGTYIFSLVKSMVNCSNHKDSQC